MRTSSALKNIYTGIMLQFISIILGIISRKIFLDKLGVELLGINGVITNLISMLGLMELGIGIAISYSLYKPLAEKNNNQIKAIMNLYSKLYRYIALVIAILGLLLMPFLGFIIKSDFSGRFINLIYFIFLTDAVVTYFLAYRRTILLADQKNYMLNRITMIFSIFLTIIQIIILVVSQNYILFLLAKLILGFGQNFIIYKITNKEYPYLKESSKPVLDLSIKGDLIKNIKALLIANISVYVIHGTDNLLLAIFTNVTVVGLYSNYTLLINAVKGLISQVFLGITAGFGNLLVYEKNLEEGHKIFNVIYFLNFWISTFCTVSLAVLSNSFIEIWIGKSMLLPIAAVAIIIFNFYSETMRSAIELVKSAAGLYSPYPFFKYWIVVEAAVNLVLSIILAGPLGLGMVGVFLGTAISTIIATYVLPWNVYKYVFKQSSKVFYLKYLLYTLISFSITIAMYYFMNLIYFNNIYISFIFKIFICLTIPNVIIIIMFYRSSELKYLSKKFIGKIDIIFHK